MANVKFPIIGVDFLRHFKLSVNPAAACLVDTASSQSFATVSAVAAAPSGQFRDKKSLDLHEKSLDLSNYEIFPHKILKSRTFKKSSILIVIKESIIPVLSNQNPI